MMKITGLSHLFKWENLHNWWLTKYFFAPLYIYSVYTVYYKDILTVINTPIHIIHRIYTSALCPHLCIVICEGATDYNLQ